MLLGGFFAISQVKAQTFTAQYSPMTDTVSSSGQKAMYNGIINLTTSTLTLNWKNISDPSALPNGWTLVDICDDNNCYAGGTLNQTHQFNLIPGDTGLLKPDIEVGDPGTGIFKVAIGELDMSDTVVFILNNSGTLGVSTVRLDDNQVSVYPNPLPAGQNMNLYVDKSLKAANAVVYNIIGQKQMVLSLTNGKELNQFDINRLPAGMYVIKVNNAQGQVITARKFTKQ